MHIKTQYITSWIGRSSELKTYFAEDIRQSRGDISLTKKVLLVIIKNISREGPRSRLKLGSYLTSYRDQLEMNVTFSVPSQCKAKIFRILKKDLKKKEDNSSANSFIVGVTGIRGTMKVTDSTESCLLQGTASTDSDKVRTGSSLFSRLISSSRAEQPFLKQNLHHLPIISEAANGYRAVIFNVKRLHSSRLFRS